MSGAASRFGPRIAMALGRVAAGAAFVMSARCAEAEAREPRTAESRVTVAADGGLVGAAAQQLAGRDGNFSACDMGCPVADATVRVNGGRLIMGLDYRLRSSRWVAERISKASAAKGNGVHRPGGFVEEKSAPGNLRARPDHYKRSGFTRGHLAPAMNHRDSQGATEATFSLANVSPQLERFNAGRWLQLELFAKSLTHLYEEVLVLTGPLFLPAARGRGDGVLWRGGDEGRLSATPLGEGPQEGLLEVRYPVLGNPPDAVPVPTHFFKVVVGLRPRRNAPSSVPGPHCDHDTAVAAFVLPHASAWPAGTELSQFVVSLPALEQVMGGRIMADALCPEAKAAVDAQGEAIGLGRGPRMARWLAAREVARRAAAGEEDGPAKPRTRSESSQPRPQDVFAGGIAPPLPVGYLALRDSHKVAASAPDLPNPMAEGVLFPPGEEPLAGTTLRRAAASAEASKPDPGSVGRNPARWRRRRARAADAPVDAFEALGQALVKQAAAAGDAVPTDNADVMVAAETLLQQAPGAEAARRAGRVLHLCSAVDCSTPPPVFRRKQDGPRWRVRWRKADEDNYDRRWFDEAMEREQRPLR